MVQNENETYSHAGEDSESLLMLTIFRNIIKRWWLFVIIGLVGAVAGFSYAVKQKTVYESYLSFALDEGGSQGGNGGAFSLAAQFGISLGGAQDIFTGDNILEIMQSRRMIEGALLSVDTFDTKPMTLIEFYLEHVNKDNRDNKSENTIHFYPGDTRDNLSYAKDSLLYNVFLDFKNFHILARRPDRKLNIYELMVNSQDEKFTKIFTDKLIDVTNHFYTEIKTKKAKETLEILEKRVPEMKGKLEQTITSKAVTQDANLNTAFASAEVPLLKAQSNSQVYGTAYAEMFKNLELARFQYLKSIPLMQIIDAADYPMNKIKPGKLKMAIIFAVIVTFLSLLIFIVINSFRFRRKIASAV